jgi:hypothetical protein
MCREETWLRLFARWWKMLTRNSVGGIERQVQRGSRKLRRSVHRKRG